MNFASSSPVKTTKIRVKLWYLSKFAFYVLTLIFLLNILWRQAIKENYPSVSSLKSYPPGRRFPFSESESDVVEANGLLELFDVDPFKKRKQFVKVDRAGETSRSHMANATHHVSHTLFCPRSIFSRQTRRPQEVYPSRLIGKLGFIAEFPDWTDLFDQLDPTNSYPTPSFAVLKPCQPSQGHSSEQSGDMPLQSPCICYCFTVDVR